MTRIVPELPATDRRLSSLGVDDLTDRAAASRARARRLWVVRTGALLAATGLLLAFLVTWHRDREVMAQGLRINQRCALALQTRLDATGLLPAKLPVAEASGYMYASYGDRFYAAQADRPVIVAASAPIGLILRPNGRCVIVYERGQIRSEWMTAAQFSNAYRAQIEDQTRFERRRLEQFPRLP